MAAPVAPSRTAAHAAGADVLVLEQDAVPRGSTAMSQGLVCAAGTAAQRAVGVHDTPERFFADIMAKTRGLTDPALARAIAQNAGPALDWLIAHADLPFELDVRFRAAYGHSVARVHGWPGHGGEDLINLLHARLQTAAVDVLFQARLVDIIAGGMGARRACLSNARMGARKNPVRHADPGHLRLRRQRRHGGGAYAAGRRGSASWARGQ